MKIAFLTAFREDHFLPGEYFLKRHMINLAPLYLASYLQASGISAEIRIADRLDDLHDFHPDILGVTAVTENFEYAKRLAQQAKRQWGALTVLGGAHITALPQSLPRVFDVGVLGEGEASFSELVNAIQSHRGLPAAQALQRIAGLVYHGPKGPLRTGPRKSLANLDHIPLIERHRYIRKLGSAYLMTSRGCPYTCDFCVIPNISSGYRVHSADYVIEEIRSIREHFPHVRHLRIFDDLFIVDKRRVRQIAERISAEGWHRELSFGCWGRANLIDASMLEAFQKMNMLYVAFGAESGSAGMVSRLKPGASLDVNQRAIDLLHDHGIYPSCSFILGHPHETEQDLWETYAFIEKNLNKLLEVEFNVAIPWPGTELWEIAKRHGQVSDDMDFNILKECAYFLNYTTDRYPYLNRNIAPERFDAILYQFKKLFRRMLEKMDQAKVGEEVNANREIPEFFSKGSNSNGLASSNIARRAQLADNEVPIKQKVSAVAI